MKTTIARLAQQALDVNGGSLGAAIQDLANLSFEPDGGGHDPADLRAAADHLVERTFNGEIGEEA